MELNNNQETFNQSNLVKETNAKKVRTTIYLPVELHKASKIYCAKNEISLTQFIINFLKQTINNNNA